MYGAITFIIGRNCAAIIYISLYILVEP